MNSMNSKKRRDKRNKKRKLHEEEESGSAQPNNASTALGSEDDDSLQVGPPSSKQRRVSEPTEAEKHTQSGLSDDKDGDYVHGSPSTPKSLRSTPTDKKKTGRRGGSATLKSSPRFKRWSGEEELCIARAMLNSLSSNGDVDKARFYAQAKEELKQEDITRSQLYEKMRTMQSRFRSIQYTLKVHDIPAHEFVFRTTHEPALFQIWNQIWGVGPDAAVGGHSHPLDEKPPHVEGQGDGGRQEEREIHTEDIEVVEVADETEKSEAAEEKMPTKLDSEIEEDKVEETETVHVEADRADDGNGDGGNKEAEKDHEKHPTTEGRQCQCRAFESIAKTVFECCELVINRAIDRIGVSLVTHGQTGCEMGIHGCLCARLRKWRQNIEEFPGLDPSLHSKAHSFKLHYLNVLIEHFGLLQEECKLTLKTLNA